jgi:hypothetical protein
MGVEGESSNAPLLRLNRLYMQCGLADMHTILEDALHLPVMDQGTLPP